MSDYTNGRALCHAVDARVADYVNTAVNNLADTLRRCCLVPFCDKYKVAFCGQPDGDFTFLDCEGNPRDVHRDRIVRPDRPLDADGDEWWISCGQDGKDIMDLLTTSVNDRMIGCSLLDYTPTWK